MTVRAKRWMAPFIALGMMVILSCGQSGGKGGSATPSFLLPQATIPQTTATITGQVIGVPEMGISYPDGATVTIVGHPEFTVKTDSAGHFQIAGVPAGSYSVSITAIDNNNQEVNYIRTVMVSGNLVDLGALNIMQTGAITGMVSLEGGGDPLGTLFYIPGTGFSGYTDETGYFIILYIPAGIYRLRFERAGYTPVEVTDINVQQGTATAIGTILMNHMAPVFTSTAPTAAGEGMGYIYNITSMDPDTSQTLTVAINTGTDTCNGSLSGSCSIITPLTGCTYNFMPDASAQSCVVGITVTDSFTPTASVDQNTTVTINRTPTITSTAGTTASQGNLYSYTVTATDPDVPAQALTCAKSVGDTCGGAFAGCVYTFTPGASAQSCVVGIQASDNGTPVLIAAQNTIVTINRTPTITSTAPTSAGQGVFYSYTVTATDPDVPAQALICAKSAGDTCGGTFAGCVYTFTPGASAQSCVVGIQVSDNGTPVLIATQNTIVTINRTPTITSTAPTSAGQGDLYSYTVTATDPDVPAQILTCAKTASDTCGGTFAGCVYTFTPGASVQSCVVGITVTDSGAPVLSASQNTTVTINRKPVWNTVPTDIKTKTSSCNDGIEFDIDPGNEIVIIGSQTCTSYQQVNGSATDSDLPNVSPGDSGFLSCSAANNTCTFPVTVTGSGAGAANCQISFNTYPVPEICHVDIVVTDGGGLSISHTTNIDVVQYMGAWLVDADAVGTNDGSSWANAFNLVQDAVNFAISGDDIWVAEGTYTRTVGAASTDTVLVMKNGVDIYGGFVGTESNLSQRGDPSSHPTVLDGQNTSYHVVVGISNSTLDGFTVTRGNANGSGQNGTAGGLYSANGTNFSINKCIISNNTAVIIGGGSYVYGTTGTISNSLFIGNKATGTINTTGAGGIVAESSQITITGCTFTQNSSNYGGGGLYFANETAAVHSSVINSLITGNTAPMAAGIRIWQGRPNIFNSTIASNTSTGSGAALYNDGSGYPTITNSVIWGNTAPSYPGIRNASGTVTATYSDIQSGYSGTGNLNVDPKFVSSTDFHLQNTSPSINTGTATGAPNNDFDGNPRPSPTGGAFDMGAYEFQITASINCASPGPNPVNELSPMQCSVTSNYGSAVIDTATDTCGGSITGAGPWTYNFTPSEAQGPEICTASVKFGTGIVRGASVTVLEVNVPPVDHAPATVIGRIDYFTTFNVNPTDSDIPVQVLTCSIDSASGECVNGVLNGCTWSWTPTAAQGPTECDVVTKAYDGVAYSANVTTHVTINGLDNSPTVIVDCPASVSEDQSTVCSLTATDPDIPAQALTCSKNPSTTCVGAVVNGCSSVNVPAQGELAGPGSCMVVVDVVDDFLPPAYGQGGDIITILEVNSAPHWSTAPSDMYVKINQLYAMNNGRALDDDMPNASSGDNGFITCSAANNTCSFPLSITGSGAGVSDCRITFTAGTGVEACAVDVNVTDGKGLSISKTISIKVNPFLGIWLVDADATGANNGTSWTDAFTVVQDAVNQAVAGEMVWVAEGTYTRPLGSPSTQSVLVMKNGVNIYGGFAGTELVLSDRVDPAGHPTVLDGQNTSYHVVIGASNSIMDGFTIMRGKAIGTSNINGAGMYNSSVTNVAVSKCIFTANNANGQGGGVYNGSSSVTITDSTFSGNSTLDAGGGIYYNSSTGSVTRCAMTGNSITGTGGYSTGGGIMLKASPVTIDRCIISQNTAAYGGGGVSAVTETSASHSTIVNSIISNNTAGMAGGLFIWQGYPTLFNCTIASNTATGSSGGGGIRNDGPGYPTITNSIIWGNTAPTGPGIFNQAGTTTVTYSDVQGGWTGTGNKNLDPQFITSTDYHIKSTSPAVDAGTATGAPGTDIEGFPRPYPVGGSFDMGAYELHAVPGEQIAVNCPANADETSPFSCPVTLVSGGPLCYVGAGDTCGGSIDLACVGPYTAPPPEAIGPGTCVVQVFNNTVSDSHTISVLEVNQNPVWGTAPGTIAVVTDKSFNFASGHATDADLPNTGLTDPGHVTCSKQSQTCSFNITVSGSGNGAVDCNLSFTTGSAGETCGVTVIVSDGYGATISGTFSVNVSATGIVYVDSDAPGAQTGLSWTDALHDVQSGINAAQAGGRVWVAQGTYVRTGGGTGPVAQLRDGIDVYGGFAGTETAFAQRGDPASHPTILDGQNSSYHVVISVSNSILDGFTITRGKAIGTGNINGAGMYNSGVTNVAVSKCIFTANSANGQGGGVYNGSSSVTITDSTFTGNSTLDAGGGIYYNSSTGSVTRCVMTGNSITGTGGYSTGGGIMLNASPVTIDRCVISQNTATYGGGGVSAVTETSASHSTIVNTLISNNTSGMAGGLFIWQGRPTLFNCTIVSNAATGGSGGGGIRNDGPGYPTITNSIIWGNTASSGAGIKNQAGTTTVTYSDVQSGWTGTGNLNADPLFVGSSDYRITSASPCKESGTAVGAPLIDLVGTSRPNGSGFDMGAYEFMNF